MATQRVRLTVSQSGDPTEELTYLARIRNFLYEHSPIEVDPDSPVHGTHRDAEGRAYFEFRTGLPEEVKRVLKEGDKANRIKFQFPKRKPGSACVNCGNIAGPVAPAVCPNCKFREISSCPHCGKDVPRQSYPEVMGDVSSCPECGKKVRFRYADPVFKRDGTFAEPLISLEKA